MSGDNTDKREGGPLSAPQSDTSTAKVEPAAAKTAGAEATKKPESPQAVVVGRTQWDAAVDVARLLGNATPYLVIAALAVFSFLKYQELAQQRDADLQKARETATENYRLQLSAANEALVKTYSSMGTISGTQIKNLAEMLELHSNTTKKTQELQQSFEQLKKQADEQKLRSEQSNRDVEAANRQKQQADIDLRAMQTTLAANRKELEGLENALAGRRRDLTDSAQQVSVVRERLIELARSVRDKKPNAIDLAQHALRENEFAVADTSGAQARPGLSLSADGLKELIGRNEADVIAALAQDPRFVAVYRLPPYGGDNWRILGARSFSDGVFRNLLDLETDGSRIVSVSTLDLLLGVRVPTIGDWFTDSSIIVLASKGRRSWYYPKSDDLEWDVSALDDTFKAAPARMIKGQDKVPYLTIEQFAKLPESETLLPTISGTVADHDLYKRSKTFDAAAVVPVSLVGLPSDLRQAAVELLNTAVRRNASGAASKVRPSLIPSLGQIASAALRPGFLIGSAVTESGSDGSSISLVATYDQESPAARRTGARTQPPAPAQQKETATFGFSRQRDGRWILERFGQGLAKPQTN